MGRGRRKRLADEPLAVKEGRVKSVAFSPDGKTIAAGYSITAAVVAEWCCGTRPVASACGRTARREGGGCRERGLQPRRQDHRGRIRRQRRQAAWCCGTRLAASGWTDDPLAVKEGRVNSVAFSPDGKTIAAGYGSGGKGGVVLWDAAARKRLDGRTTRREGGLRLERGLQPRRQDHRGRILRCR